MSGDIGDYYRRCDQRRRAAYVNLQRAKCRSCHGMGNANAGTPRYRDYVRCSQCGGSGNAPGVTYEERRQLEREYERAADTGD